jgi:uncharacterized protein YndB with AHSA1/START domain
MRTMTALVRSTIINAPVDDVFAFLQEPTKSWPCMPHTTVHGISKTPEGVGTTFVWESTVLGVHVKGNITYTEYVPGGRLALTSSKGFRFTFNLELADEGTRITLIEEDLPGNWAEAAVDAVAMKLTQHDLEVFLANLKAAIEAE